VPYLARIVRHGFDAAIRADAGLGLGVPLHKGKAVSEAAAVALGLPASRIEEIPADAGGSGAA
jgi:alanine dehydrogenase